MFASSNNGKFTLICFKSLFKVLLLAVSMVDLFRDVPESDEEKLKRFGREIHFPSLLHPVRPFQDDEGKF